MKTKFLTFTCSLLLHSLVMANCKINFYNISGKDVTLYSFPIYGNIYFNNQKNLRSFVLHNLSAIRTKETTDGGLARGNIYINCKPKDMPRACSIYYYHRNGASHSYIDEWYCSDYAFNLSPYNSCYTTIVITFVPGF